MAVATGRWQQYLSSAGAQSISRALSVAANLLSLVLVARVLGTNDFGNYTFVMACVNIAATLADLGTTSVLAHGLTTDSHAEPDLYFGNFLVIRAATTLAATLLALAAIPFADRGLLGPLLVCAISIPFVASRFFDPVYQVFGRPRYSVYASLLYSVSLAAVSLVLLPWLHVPLLDYLWAWVGCNVLYTILAFHLATRVVRPRFDIRWQALKSIAALAIPLGVGALFYIVNTRADVMMLSYMTTPRDTGLYGAAYKLLDFGGMLAVTALWPLIPILSREQRAGKEGALVAIRCVTEVAGVLSFPVAVVAQYLALPIITLLYGADYAEAASVVGILAVIFVILIYCLIGVVANLSTGTVQHSYWNTAVAAVINIALNFVLIPRHGMVGAAWAALVSHVWMLLVQQRYVLVHAGNPFVLGFWLKLVGANAALLAALQLSHADRNPLVVPFAVMAYAAFVHVFRLIPEEILSALGRSRAGRRAGVSAP